MKLADIAGVYVIKLVVGDGTANSEAATVTITATQVNKPATIPVVETALATDPPANIPEGLKVTCNFRQWPAIRRESYLTD